MCYSVPLKTSADSTGFSCKQKYDVVGTDIQGLDVDERGCREACSRNAECTFYVLLVDNRYGFRCWLKKDYGTGPNGFTGPADWVVTMCQKTGGQADAATCYDSVSITRRHFS